VGGGTIVVVVVAGTQTICPARHASITPFAHRARSMPPGGPHVASI